jgi:hypothetical protein
MSRFLWVIAFVLALAPRAEAAPMFTPFATVRAAPTIVLGVVDVDAQGNVTVNVDAVIRGAPRTGRTSVNQSPDGHITVSGERVVAFIDSSNALRWVGRLVAGPTLETGVIKLQGFFDFNAHLVEPGIVSLAQLRTAIRTGALVQTFEATLAFPDGRGGFRAVPAKHFTVQWDAMASRILGLQGLSPACLANPSLFGLSWGSFSLSLSDTCLTNASTRSRSLSFDGEFTGVAPSGAINVRVEPSRPFLTETEYDAFVRDPDAVDVVNIVRIAAGGATWTWRIEDSVADSRGKVRKAGGMSSSQSQTASGKLVSTDTYEFEDVKIILSPSAALGSPGGNARGIIQLIESPGPLSCTLRVRGAADVACMLTHAPSIVVRR